MNSDGCFYAVISSLQVSTLETYVSDSNIEFTYIPLIPLPINSVDRLAVNLINRSNRHQLNSILNSNLDSNLNNMVTSNSSDEIVMEIESSMIDEMALFHLKYCLNLAAGHPKTVDSLLVYLSTVMDDYSKMTLRSCTAACIHLKPVNNNILSAALLGNFIPYKNIEDSIDNGGIITRPNRMFRETYIIPILSPLVLHISSCGEFIHDLLQIDAINERKSFEIFIFDWLQYLYFRNENENENVNINPNKYIDFKNLFLTRICNTFKETSCRQELDRQLNRVTNLDNFPSVYIADSISFHQNISKKQYKNITFRSNDLNFINYVHNSLCKGESVIFQPSSEDPRNLGFNIGCCSKTINNEKHMIFIQIKSYLLSTNDIETTLTQTIVKETIINCVKHSKWFFDNKYNPCLIFLNNFQTTSTNVLSNNPFNNNINETDELYKYNLWKNTIVITKEGLADLLGPSLAILLENATSNINLMKRWILFY